MCCSLDGWMDEWMDRERRGVLDICLGRAGDVAVWKDAKWCVSQLVSGRGKEETAKIKTKRGKGGRRKIDQRHKASLLAHKLLFVVVVVTSFKFRNH